MEYQRKKVDGFEEYQVDTDGIVYSKKGRPLKYSINHNGYCIINFYVDHKRTGFAIHTLVAQAFIPNPENKPTVNHKNGNKQKNNAENLEWATYQEQMEHAINILKLNIGGHNKKEIIGFDKSGKIIYKFDSLLNCSKFFCKENKNPRYVQNSIWRATNGLRKTYRRLFWQYTEIEQQEIII